MLEPCFSEVEALSDSLGKSARRMLPGKVNDLLTQTSSDLKIGFRLPEGSVGALKWPGNPSWAPAHVGGPADGQPGPLTGESLGMHFLWAASGRLT